MEDVHNVVVCLDAVCDMFPCLFDLFCIICAHAHVLHTLIHTRLFLGI